MDLTCINYSDVFAALQKVTFKIMGKASTSLRAIKVMVMTTMEKATALPVKVRTVETMKGIMGQKEVKALRGTTDPDLKTKN